MSFHLPVIYGEVYVDSVFTQPCRKGEEAEAIDRRTPEVGQSKSRTLCLSSILYQSFCHYLLSA